MPIFDALIDLGFQNTDMKTGDRVTLVGIPSNLRDDEELQTRQLFEKCLGRSFVISAVESFDGVPYPLAKIDVGHVVGEDPWMHTIWVELEYLQVENSPKSEP